ncbi:hypothetical protein X777_14138 [Ooceraea biroi]|uniref:Uncharacterized protein n=1 Tax=Ooceraea biroi TaxID=2015173 RepID=A0A026VX69_OOCBI|nr:hypothetical protein X777_14138 [Ooceraea biroi]
MEWDGLANRRTLSGLALSTHISEATLVLISSSSLIDNSKFYVVTYLWAKGFSSYAARHPVYTGFYYINNYYLRET